MTLQQFIEKYNGKYIDFDQAWGNQCFDLFHQFVVEVLGLTDPRIMAAPAAKDLYNNFNNLKGHEYFERIPNTPMGVPNEGDIVIFGSGTYGHVSIFIEGDANNFKSFDQNYPVGSPCHIQGHTYSSCLGWLRYKGQQSVDNELQVCLQHHTLLVTELEKIKEALRKAVDINNENRNELESKNSQVQGYQDNLKAIASNLTSSDNQVLPDVVSIQGAIVKLKEEEDQLRQTIQSNETLKKSNENMALEMKTMAETNTRLQLENKTVLGQVQTVEGHAREWQGKYEQCAGQLKFKPLISILGLYICQEVK